MVLHVDGHILVVVGLRGVLVVLFSQQKHFKLESDSLLHEVDLDSLGDNLVSLGFDLVLDLFPLVIELNPIFLLVEPHQHPDTAVDPLAQHTDRFSLHFIF